MSDVCTWWTTDEGDEHLGGACTANLSVCFQWAFADSDSHGLGILVLDEMPARDAVPILERALRRLDENDKDVLARFGWAHVSTARDYLVGIVHACRWASANAVLRVSF